MEHFGCKTKIHTVWERDSACWSLYAMCSKQDGGNLTSTSTCTRLLLCIDNPCIMLVHWLANSWFKITYGSQTFSIGHWGCWKWWCCPASLPPYIPNRFNVSMIHFRWPGTWIQFTINCKCRKPLIQPNIIIWDTSSPWLLCLSNSVSCLSRQYWHRIGEYKNWMRFSHLFCHQVRSGWVHQMC